ncbi:GntR family transcriptional regulator [Lentibacillus amyloliquefaciens]|uniref:GntR family transcriptional regulator n=1 Tax=Lentibacillus amyloliquefaciens TaxID=1472767 RepID=A0A0U4FFJ0_9BACI|nr:GntR family transcriptional regulator [Lentibacillus amyloliquefaciens]ALX49293.1 GntR family transcriptional regulator [Lentibacillus amyloliquefaciens]
MMINPDSAKPIYIQISEWIENEILNENFKPDEKVHSQYKLADMFNINPATAAKGLTLLSEEKILYNKRGLGKFVSSDAKAIITEKRKDKTLKRLIQEAVLEAERLHVDEKELMNMMKKTINERKGDAT